MTRVLYLLNALGIFESTRHSDAVVRWQQAGRIGPEPERAELPFARLIRIFSNVFPELELVVTSDSRLNVRKGQHEYAIGEMSDGEKQIFMLTADILALKTGMQLFLIDEPELNLHPSLAETFWNIIEDEFYDSTFIYATHNIAFALREGVETIVVLGFGEIERDKISIRDENIAPFLGSFPLVLKAPKCLLVEGTDASIDLPLYRWLTGRSDFSVVPLGGSSEVSLAAGRKGLWEQLQNNIRVVGVVDRDFKMDGTNFSNCITLPFHEAESILSHPDIIYSLQSNLSNLLNPASTAQLIDVLVTSAEKRLFFVAAKRVFSRLTIKLGVSIENMVLEQLKDKSQLTAMIESMAKAEVSKAAALTDLSQLQSIIDQEINNCKKAITNKDVFMLLQIFEGKEFLGRVLRFSGCHTPAAFMKSVAKHLQPSAFPFLVPLINSLNEALQ